MLTSGTYAVRHASVRPSTLRFPPVSAFKGSRSGKSLSHPRRLNVAASYGISLSHVRSKTYAVVTPHPISATKNQLDQLQEMSIIVEDSGDYETIRTHSPHDATTNPSLIYQASLLPEYKPLLVQAIQYGKTRGGTFGTSRLTHAADMLSCLFGKEIAAIVPGYVSTEVDARLSFDTKASVAKAHELLDIYETLGVDRKRILIKLASTWEMMEACEELEKGGVSTNMTLIFSKVQAVAAAQRHATLVSPFVGRILDWYKKDTGQTWYPPNEDPGVLSVKSIYDYYKCHRHDTVIMGASFRNKDEILELAGCDRLTISPKLLDELMASHEPVRRKLTVEASQASAVLHMHVDERGFRWGMNEDPMATEQLAAGIRGFSADHVKLETRLGETMMQM